LVTNKNHIFEGA